MLANLDNEVHFKKVLTDVEVFTAFVKDVLGIEVAVIEDSTKKEAIKRILIRGKVSSQEIAEDFEVTVEYVKQIEKEIKNA